MYGIDFAYAGTRVQGTIVRIRETNEPVYVHIIGRDGNCLVSLVETLTVHIAVHLDELNLQPISLGYVNTAGQATYFQRIPKRKDWKQGLRAENCLSSGRRLFDFPMESFRQAVKNEYPNYKRALEGIKTKSSKTKTIAFHRSWAVTSNRELLYKNHLYVGDIVDDQPVLHPSYAYLKEFLAEVV